MSFKKPPSPVAPELEIPCEFDLVSFFFLQTIPSVHYDKLLSSMFPFSFVLLHCTFVAWLLENCICVYLSFWFQTFPFYYIALKSACSERVMIVVNKRIGCLRLVAWENCQECILKLLEILSSILLDKLDEYYHFQLTIIFAVFPRLTTHLPIIFYFQERRFCISNFQQVILLM